MNKKENRMAVRQAAQQAVIRDEQNHRIEHAATNPIKEVLKSLHTTLRGLDAENIVVSRTKYGTNKVTHEKKQSLVKRLAGAFINPFTAILFCLAVVSTMTDMVFPYFSLLGSSPEDFDPLTVVIILTMVMISGTLRFVQESRSGNAAEKLLSMITTTCTVTRREQEKIYAGHGSAGIFYQWYHKGRLAGCLPVWYFCGSRTDTGDVTDDRNNLPCERCRFHE